MRMKNLISHKRKHKLSKLGKWWPSASLKCSVQNDTVNFTLCLFLIWWEFPFQHFQSVLLLLWVWTWKRTSLKPECWNKLYPKLVAFAEVLDAIKSYFSSLKFSIFLMLLSLGIDITITRAFFLCFFTTTMPGWSAITSLCVYGSPTGSELSYSRSPLGAYPILPPELPGHTRHPHMCLLWRINLWPQGVLGGISLVEMQSCSEATDW